MSQLKTIRTRYAPSPTGYFHIGGARSALFNYLYAKNKQGKFILRIEDTDTERNVEGGIKSQYDNLIWLGIIPDESLYNPNPKYGPYLQSKKFDLYKEIAQELIDKNLAYRCFCSAETLEQDRIYDEQHKIAPKYHRHCLNLSKEEIQAKLHQNIPYTVRLKIQDNQTYTWNDLIRGKQVVKSDTMTDLVILKSNGIATYNFCNPIDDHDMQITTIIRGQEHLTNTSFQLAIIDALKQLNRYQDSLDDFNFTYGHLPVVVNADGKKLSKRDTTLKQFISDYKAMGFLPMGIVNFLVLLGWTSPKNQELFYDMNEIIAQFDGSRISKAPGYFDFKKMLWVNKKHIEHLSDEKYINLAKPFVTIPLGVLENKIDEILLLFKKEISCFSELNPLIDNLFHPTLIINEEQQAILNDAYEHELFQIAHDSFNDLSDIESATITSWLKEISLRSHLKGKELYLPLRMMIFKQEHGAEFPKLIHLFGKEYVLEQLNKAMNRK